MTRRTPGLGGVAHHPFKDASHHIDPAYASTLPPFVEKREGERGLIINHLAQDLLRPLHQNFILNGRRDDYQELERGILAGEFDELPLNGIVDLNIFRQLVDDSPEVCRGIMQTLQMQAPLDISNLSIKFNSLNENSSSLSPSFHMQLADGRSIDIISDPRSKPSLAYKESTSYQMEYRNNSENIWHYYGSDVDSYAHRIISIYQYCLEIQANVLDEARWEEIKNTSLDLSPLEVQLEPVEYYQLQNEYAVQLNNLIPADIPVNYADNRRLYEPPIDLEEFAQFLQTELPFILESVRADGQNRNLRRVVISETREEGYASTEMMLVFQGEEEYVPITLNLQFRGFEGKDEELSVHLVNNLSTADPESFQVAEERLNQINQDPEALQDVIEKLINKVVVLSS